MKTFAAIAILSGLLAVGFSIHAQTLEWTQSSAPSGGWTNVVMSADGSKLVAVSIATAIYSSTNFGGSWISNSVVVGHSQYPIYGWESVASSASGSNLWLTDGHGDLFVSTNFGVTWAFPQSTPDQPPISVAVCADGTKIFACGSGGIWISTNSGQGFVQTYSSTIKQVSSGANGKVIMACSGVFNSISTNFGLTWNGVSSESETRGGGVSGDGNTMVQVRDSGIFVSTNRGAVFNFVLNEENFGFSPVVAMSANGQRIFITGFNTNVVYSTNYGINWMTNHSPAFFNAIACSVDGNRLEASGGPVRYGPNYVYLAYLQPSPQINALSVSNQLALSWTMPSTNMILQQSEDLNNWTLTTNPPTLNLTNLQERVTLPTLNGASFFRLISQ